MSDISREDVYKFIRRGKPEVYNPSLDPEQEWHEVLIGCKCNHQYVVRVNGEYATIPGNLGDLDIGCPFCQRSIAEWISASKHSGGVFNAMYRRRMSHERI